ncbi:MAG: neutral zinc metallopeptidase [Deltaproteobacteria bacterium]|nr:neutral zinc metallopeptidase [Deltaproteobacteria bacterium]
MKWTRGTRNDDVVDVRGRAPRGGAALKLGGGGLVAALVVFAVSRIIGVDLSGLVGGGESSSAASGSATSEPPQGPDPDAELVDYVKFVMKDIQDTFQGQYEAAGKPYRRARLYVFSEAIDTACGRSSSAIGPFYCPGDEQAYVDLTFFRDLRQRFGAPGNFAQAYVLAHEVGHHLQTLNGIEKQTARLGRDKRSRNEASVRQELQADCYAGVWGQAAQGRKLLEAGDLEGALTAASAIGDDRLQKQAGVDVDPETFTHGTSAQRMRWFRRGFDTGRLDACDTFSTQEL